MLGLFGKSDRNWQLHNIIEIIKTMSNINNAISTLGKRTSFRSYHVKP